MGLGGTCQLIIAFHNAMHIGMLLAFGALQIQAGRALNMDCSSLLLKILYP